MPTTAIKYATSGFSNNTFAPISQALGSGIGSYAQWVSSAPPGDINSVSSLLLDGYDFSEVPTGSILTQVLLTIRSYVSNPALFDLQSGTIYLNGTELGSGDVTSSTTPADRLVTIDTYTRVDAGVSIQAFNTFLRSLSSGTTRSYAYCDRMGVQITYQLPAGGGFFF